MSEELRTAIAESASIAEVLRRLGRPNNSWQRAQVRNWIAEHQVDTSHFLGQ